MIVIDWLLMIIAGLLCLPVMVLLVQVLAAILLKPDFEVDTAPVDASISVLIPAHNESQGIVATLNSIKPQLKPNDRILVVADNCSDDTADVVARNGVEVIKRNDSNNRGKGYALDFGLRHLAQNPPKVVVVIDADCVLEANTLNQLAVSALKSGRPAQALYLMYAKGSDFKSKISEFAWCVKNLVRPLGYANLGLPCQLMGTGMAFPWNIIINADLANDNIVEDMKLGIDLSIAGTSPLFNSASVVTSYFPELSEVQSGQKTRWEHGHLTMILAEAPRLLFKGVYKRDISLLAMAFDLAVPPLTLLVMLLFGYAGFTSIILVAYDVGHFALQLTMFAIIVLTISTAVAWWGWGRKIISLRILLNVPIYIILKIPHYIKFLFKRQKIWNKTERD